MLLKYLAAWFGMMIIAVINGSVREVLYKPHVGELAAHQISTLTLFIMFTAYFWFLDSIWPIETGVQAWTIGAIWVVMTLAFEFGVGRYVSGNSWSKVLYDYNLLAGRVWVFIPIWVLIAPYILFILRKSR